MSEYTTFYCGQTLVIPNADAAKLLSLLKKAQVLERDWSSDEIALSNDVSYTFNSFSSEKRENILKAQILGMTYGEYLNAQRESAESVSSDTSVST